MSSGDTEEEDSTMPMYTSPDGTVTGGGGAVVVVLVLVLVLVGRGCTVDLMEVKTVVRRILGLESVVWD